MTETITILMGDYGERACVFHSHYMGWEIWREYNVFKARPMMSYFAVLDGREPLHSGNLAGIKEAVKEARDDERDQEDDLRHLRGIRGAEGVRRAPGLDAPDRVAPPGRQRRRILGQRRFRRVPRLHHGGRRPDQPGGGVPHRVQQCSQEDGPMAPIGPLPSIECAICGRHPTIPFQAKPTRRYLLAKLRDDGWSIRMLGDGRYVGKCPDCCDLQERMERDERSVQDMREEGR